MNAVSTNTETAPAPAPVVCDEPAARFDAYGSAALSDRELLSLILGNASASDLILKAGGMHALARWTGAEYSAIPGIGKAMARRMGVLTELARRMARVPFELEPVLNRPEKIAEFMRPHCLGLGVEKFWVACLNRKNRLLKLAEVTSGTATSSLAHPREVFREAIRNGATAIVCIHNHPSGDPAPSAADVQVTRQLREAAKAVDIDLLDHLICGLAPADPCGRGFYSFREAGLL